MEREVILEFLSDTLKIQKPEISEITDEWFLRCVVSSFFPSAPEPVDPLRFLRATSPLLSWDVSNCDAVLRCLLKVAVRSEAKDTILGQIFARPKLEQDILIRLIKENETSDENTPPKEENLELKREISQLKRQLEISNVENLRLKAEFKRRESLLLQVVHSLGVKLGQQGLLNDEN